MARDMTKEAFRQKCEDYGFVPQGFLGYYSLASPCDNHHVSVLNAGPSRRERLAYLIAQQQRAEKEVARATGDLR